MWGLPKGISNGNWSIPKRYRPQIGLGTGFSDRNPTITVGEPTWGYLWEKIPRSGNSPFRGTSPDSHWGFQGWWPHNFSIWSWGNNFVWAPWAPNTGLLLCREIHCSRPHFRLPPGEPKKLWGALRHSLDFSTHKPQLFSAVLPQRGPVIFIGKGSSPQRSPNGTL